MMTGTFFWLEIAAELGMFVRCVIVMQKPLSLPLIVPLPPNNIALTAAIFATSNGQ
jgi:hypothetical protein